MSAQTNVNEYPSMTEKENTVIFKTGSKILKYISQKTQLSKTIMNDFTLNQVIF